MTLIELRARYAAAITAMREAGDAVTAAPDDEAVYATFVESRDAAESSRTAVERAEAIERARAAHPDPEPVEPTPAASTERARETTDPGPAVVRDEPTYHQGAQHSFFRDIIAVKDGDPDARARLMRSNGEVAEEMATRARHAAPAERGRAEAQARAISQTATAGGEFIPPVWMNDQYAILLRAGRAFADQCISEPLPDGTNSLNVPKITTGASTAVQADGGAVSNTDLVTTSVTAQVQTIAGRTIASYQLIDMGQPSMDGIIFQDLLADYWRTLDTALINGAVTNAKGVLNVTGINAVTYTDASPTGPEMYAPVMQGKSQIEKGAFVGVDFMLWHPSAWNFYLASLDSSNRPLALATDLPSFNAMATFNPIAQGIAGNFAGIPVVIDANVPVNLGAGTNESRIVMVNRQTLRTYEGVPRFKIADQTNIANLQYQFVLYGYYACAFARQPKMISALSGTGLIVQSGY